jgi:hypothetical protein
MFRTHLILLVMVLTIADSSAHSQLLAVSSCSEDANISAAKRKLIESAANNFLQKLLTGASEDVVVMMSKDGQANVTREQLKSYVAMLSQQWKPQNTSIQHTYLLKLIGKSAGRILCGRDLKKPDGWESLKAADVSEQAYVSISAETINNRLVFTIWLVPEETSWKIQSIWMNVATLADKDSLWLWQFAEEQRKKGHNFNAALYYAAAAQVSNRDPNFQMGIVQSISEDVATLTVPPEVKGPPPFFWKNGEQTYKVLQVGPMAIGGKIYLALHHEVSPWQSNEQVDGWNKDFIRYIKQRLPEYSDAFAGLIIRAVERGTSRGFGTVE